MHLPGRGINMDKANYSNWVSNKFIYGPGILAILFLGSSFLSSFLLIGAILFLLITGYFFYARSLLASGGGKIQDQIQELVLQHLAWDGKGKALDIGCGNGPLTNKLAKKYPAAKVTGTDSWGKGWDYAKRVCDENARLEGVSGRVEFQKASAVHLPFPDGGFDAAVSNLVFHEVSKARDKRELIREALRVVRKGGVFAFQDLFQLKRVYGEPQELVETLKGWGITKVEYLDTSKSEFIPHALKLPFMVGSMGILYGIK